MLPRYCLSQWNGSRWPFNSFQLFVLFDFNSLHFSFCLFKVLFCFALLRYNFLFFTGNNKIAKLNYSHLERPSGQQWLKMEIIAGTDTSRFPAFSAGTTVCYWNFSSLFEWCTKLFPSLALFLLDLIDKWTAFNFSYGTFFFFSFRRRCCTHGIKPINSILYDPARFQQTITAPDTLSIYSGRFSLCDRKSIVGTALRARNVIFAPALNLEKTAPKKRTPNA